MPLQESHYGGLASGSAPLDNFLPLALVHEPGLAANIGFVNLNLAGHAAEVAVLHRQPDTMEHEPSGFFGNADGSCDFVGADAVLGAGNHPDSSKL